MDNKILIPTIIVLFLLWLYLEFSNIKKEREKKKKEILAIYNKRIKKHTDTLDMVSRFAPQTTIALLHLMIAHDYSVVNKYHNKKYKVNEIKHKLASEKKIDEHEIYPVDESNAILPDILDQVIKHLNKAKTVYAGKIKKLIITELRKAMAAKYEYKIKRAINKGTDALMDSLYGTARGNFEFARSLNDKYKSLVFKPNKYDDIINSNLLYIKEQLALAPNKKQQRG
jgi:hypothetical protein